MNTDTLEQRIRQKVIDRVERGGVTMRSRAYFVARAGAAIAVSVLVLLLSAYVLSFIVFSIHESGEQFLLGFGRRGVQTFFTLFPWTILGVDIASIAFLEWLLQSFKFGYRISLLALFGAIVLVSILLASTINLTPLHGDLLERADHGNLPIIGEMYERIRDSHGDEGVFRGTIAAIQGNQITIMHDDNDHDADDGTRIVILPTGYSTTTFSVGERVYVFGRAGSTTVEAYGLNRLSPDQ